MAAATKKPAVGGFFNASKNRSHLLDLAFLVDHVFAYRRVIFADLDLLRMKPLVLGRRVEVPGSC